MINDFYNKYFIVKRGTWLTDEEENPYSAEIEVSNFMGQIQQAQAELVQNLGMSLTTAYSVWCPLDTNILAGDTLVSVDGVYSVKAIMKYENGINKHLQIVVQFDKELYNGS